MATAISVTGQASLPRRFDFAGGMSATPCEGLTWPLGPARRNSRRGVPVPHIVTDSAPAAGVDTPEELEKVRKILDRRASGRI